MASAAEIRDHVRQWVDGKVSLREFQEWFVPATWDVHRSGDSELESLVDEIELNLSEYSDRLMTASELRKELAKAVRPFVASIRIRSSYAAEIHASLNVIVRRPRRAPINVYSDLIPVARTQ